MIVDKRNSVAFTRVEFLSNKVNKEQLISLNLLSVTFIKSPRITVFQSKGDADVLIVQKAIEKAKSDEVTVYADDTDILILLCHHYDATKHYTIYFCTQRAQKRQLRRK